MTDASQALSQADERTVNVTLMFSNSNDQRLFNILLGGFLSLPNERGGKESFFNLKQPPRARGHQRAPLSGRTDHVKDALPKSHKRDRFRSWVFRGIVTDDSG